MASVKSESIAERQGQSITGSRAQSQSSLNAPPNFTPYQQPSAAPHYPIPRSLPRKSPFFTRRTERKGRGRSYVWIGVFQAFIGLILLVLALVGLSVSRNGSAYSAGFIGGVCFIITGGFGCAVGSYDDDCYAMTYFVLNLISIPAALLCIGLSGWEVAGMGIAETLRSSEGYLTVKCALAILGCISVMLISGFQAYKLRHVECCECRRRKRHMGVPRGSAYTGPMECAVPASNTTTNSSWHWNLQHQVHQGPPDPQQQYLQQRYLEHMEAQDDPFPSEKVYPTAQQMSKASYDPGREADVHVQPAYI